MVPPLGTSFFGSSVFVSATPGQEQEWSYLFPCVIENLRLTPSMTDLGQNEVLPQLGLTPSPKNPTPFYGSQDVPSGK